MELKNIKRTEELQKTVYTAESDSFKTYFQKIWNYRALIWVFAKRDLKVKYSQTLIGVGWSIVQPLTALLIYTFFFGLLFNWDAGVIPFPVYVISGLLGWNFYTYIVSAGAMSVQEAAHTIKKIYFPKSILPFSKVVIAFVELLFSLLLLIPLMIYYDVALSWKIVFLPFVLLFNAMCGLTLVFWVASFAYKKRDLFHLLPFIVYFGIWLTPVFFTENFFPEKVQFLLDFNPMANVVGLWRWILFGQTNFEWIWLINYGLITIACIGGMYYYNRKESAFTDYV